MWQLCRLKRIRCKVQSTHNVESSKNAPAEMTAGTMKLFPGAEKEANAVNEWSRASCDTDATRSFSLQHQTGEDGDLGAARIKDETRTDDELNSAMALSASSLQSKISSNADRGLTPWTALSTRSSANEGSAATRRGTLGCAERKAQEVGAGSAAVRVKKES
jgi:hypothetical protein